MKKFNQLVGEQLKIMDNLLYIQMEIERYQEQEEEWRLAKDEENAKIVHKQINKMKEELKKIQQQFEAQTKEVILSFNEEVEKEIHV
jgi:AAA+ superfamily predicted ATPase